MTQPLLLLSLVSCFFKSSVFSSGHDAWKAPPHLKMRDTASDTLALPMKKLLILYHPNNP
jgi:hypothetical protein